MTCYFRQLHSRIDNFDYKQIEKLLYKPNCEFEEVSHQFHLIDDQTTSVIINWGSSVELIQKLISDGPSYSLMKKLAQYSVSVRKRDFKQLLSIGAVDEPYEKIYVITNPSFYKADTGLTMENQWLEETLIL